MIVSEMCLILWALLTYLQCIFHSQTIKFSYETALSFCFVNITSPSHVSKRLSF